MYYELLLDTLQVKDTVTEVEVQYLGKVPGEQRIIADNGNYDCDLQSCRMEYGKHYGRMCRGRYCWESNRKWDRRMQKREKHRKNSFREQRRHESGTDYNSGDGAGSTDAGSWTEAGTCWSVCIGKYHMESICFRCGGGCCSPNSSRL